MRAIAQGLDERVSWDRYLRMEGMVTDARVIRRTIKWIRDEFAAAAKRERKPGIARLVLIDTSRISTAPEVPDLAQFAEERGMEDFSESEVLDAYREAFPSTETGRPGRKSAATRRAHVVERQLQALHWLQSIAVRDPRPDDRISEWLDPMLARRLHQAGLDTLAQLGIRINAAGPDWWAPIRGVGFRKAARVHEWLIAQDEILGLGVSPLRAPVAPAQPGSQPVVLKEGIVPIDRLVLPPALDGSAGANRAPRASCRLGAHDDREAIATWLETKRGSATPAATATERSYRRESERLLLWAVLEREKALSSMDVVDAAEFLNFLRNPPPEWCAPRYTLRRSVHWRPLEGPLSPTAARQSHVILRGLFNFLVHMGYLSANPFDAPVSPRYVRG